MCGELPAFSIQVIYADKLLLTKGANYRQLAEGKSQLMLLQFYMLLFSR